MLTVAEMRHWKGTLFYAMQRSFSEKILNFDIYTYLIKTEIS